MEHTLKTLITKHAGTPHIELEFRLGKIGRGQFDTNVGKDTFEKALRRLVKYSGWEKKVTTRSTIYYAKNGRRAVSDDDTDEVVRVIKKRIHVSDFKLDDQPFDVRLGISTEVPYELDDSDEFDELKTRTRYSFIRKNLSIDISEVKGNPDDPDSEDDTSFHIELEIIKPSDIGSDDELSNLIHKIYDVLAILK
jgi:hypothetical protein